MKKWMISTVVALMAMTSVSAQERVERSDKSPQERAQEQTLRMEKELGLDAAQTERVAAINLQYAEKGAALKAAQKAQREAARQEMKELMTARQSELEAVLNEEQMAKLVAHQEQMKAQMKERRQLQEHKGPPPSK